MSIVTKTGDLGLTSLMYNRRVPKTHPRVEACGSVDELNAALGLARAAVTIHEIQATLGTIQRDLVVLMGELATEEADLSRYTQDGYQRVGPELIARLDSLIAELEQRAKPLRGWAIPGDTLAGAALDVARTTCRRAERRVCALRDFGNAGQAEITVYLNRLSDLLWLLARRVDAAGRSAEAR